MKRVLYPLRIAVSLMIVSIVLYLFFNIWPIVYSVYVAFTDANNNNIVQSPKLLELLKEREELVKTLESRRQEILAFLSRVDNASTNLERSIEEYLAYINQTSPEQISIQKLNEMINVIGSRALDLGSLISTPGYYLDRYPEIRDNASEAVSFISKFRSDVSSILFFKTRLTQKDLDELRNISYKYLGAALTDLSRMLSALRTLETNYDLFVKGVTKYVDEEIDKLTLHFVGLDNFAKLFGEAVFPYGIYKTLLFVATSVPLKMLLGVTLAFLFSSPLVVGRRIFRGLLIIPWALPILLTVTTWRTLFDPKWGPFAHLFSELLGRSFTIYNSEWDAFTVYNIVEMWLAYPFIMTVTMGAIASIPQELIEASYIDGAGIFTRFIKISLPLTIRPIAFAAIMTTGASLQIFMVPLLINGGGPATMIYFLGTKPVLGNTNDFMLLYAYRQAYYYYNYGLSAAAYLVAVLILLIYALAWYYFFYRRGR